MTAVKDYAPQIRTVMDLRRNTPLSQAALEVLAVVAYNQPVTKAFVEQVRGVDCSGVIGSLTTKGLVEEKGRLELPGRPLLYGTTEHFLRCFNIASLDELPPLPEDGEKKEEEEAEEESGDVQMSVFDEQSDDASDS
jgi:segregation and condensation protein B